MTTQIQGERYRMVDEKLFYNNEMMKKIATDMADISLSLKPGDKLLIQSHPGGLQLQEYLVDIARDRGVDIRIQVYDPVRKAEELKRLDVGKPYDFSTNPMVVEYNDAANWANKVAYLYAYANPQAFQDVDTNILSSWEKAIETIRRMVSNTKRRVLTHLPTPAEAQLENMTFDDYVDMFYTVINRDWEQVTEAQDILINEYLDPGKDLELLADFDEETKQYRTHLNMSIDGMTFANSTILANYPGSEVFSAPARGTISGVLTLPYPVMFAGKQLPNLTLIFDKGKIIEHHVDDNTELEEFVHSVLDSDEGAREVGEIAIGTNPEFKKPMLNPLFVEKVGGSFHIAVGRSYKYKQYAGKPVNVDNGVQSDRHIDLTRLMTQYYGGGKVILDGKILQENGKFVDPRLNILNAED